MRALRTVRTYELTSREWGNRGRMAIYKSIRWHLSLGAIGFRVAKSITVALPGSRHPPGAWSALRRGAELGPYSVTVYPEYPREAPFMWQEARGLVFVAVEKSAAEPRQPPNQFAPDPAFGDLGGVGQFCLPAFELGVHAA